MLKTFLGLKENQQIVGIDFSFGGGTWINSLLFVVLGLVLAAAAVGMVVYLYVWESKVSTGRRFFMGLCKVLALLILIIIIMAPVAGVQMTQPIRRNFLVLVDTSKSMSIDDKRITAEDVSEAAKVLGKLPLDQKLDGAKSNAMRQQIESATRFELAKAALTHSEIGVLAELNKQFNVRLVSFDKETTVEDIKDAMAGFTGRKPDGSESQVGTAIQKAVDDYGSRNVAGVVVLSDFAWATGKPPVQVARILKKQNVPVFTVPVGLAKPPDVHLRSVVAPSVVFKEQQVRIPVKIESHRFEGMRANLEMSASGRQLDKKEIVLKNGLQIAELAYRPEKDSGFVHLKFTVTPLPGAPEEVTLQNNAVSHKVEVLDQKIKVLYIEGMPRWEFRYLRRVLLRDERLDVKFLMTKGDPELAKTAPWRYLTRFPQVAKDAFKYDLIILGDVPASYFNNTQMELMEDLIKRRSGSLLMVAGPVGAPGTYGETPIGKMLPVRLAAGKWEYTNEGPVVTPEGAESSITTLSADPQSNAQIWSTVKPMYLPPLAGAKPGATVLLTKKHNQAVQLQDYPLIAWHRYGTGKCMFVATEDLWRMRLQVGDYHHAKFWGNAIQFLALSRLMGKNKQITLETNRPRYSAGDQIRIFANVVTQSFEPVEQGSYTVTMHRKNADPKEVALNPVPGSPGLYSGEHLAGADGDYQLKTLPPDAAVSNIANFEIKTLPMEERETAMQVEVAAQIAEQSGGKQLKLTELGNLPNILGEEPPTFKSERLQLPLWNTPILYILLGLFAGAEWFMRRRNNLV